MSYTQYGFERKIVAATISMHKMCTVASENGDVQCQNAASSGTQCQTKGGGGSAKIGFYIFSFSPVFFKELYFFSPFVQCKCKFLVNVVLLRVSWF